MRGTLALWMSVSAAFWQQLPGAMGQEHELIFFFSLEDSFHNVKSVSQ